MQLEKALSIESFTQEQDMLRKMIREELAAVQDKQIERLIKIALKGTFASASVMYLVGKLIADDYADEAGLVNILANASKQADAYLKRKEKSSEEYIAEAKKLIADADTLTKVDDR